MILRLSLVWCIIWMALAPVSGQNFFQKLLRPSAAQQTVVPEVTGIQSYAGYIFSDGKDTLTRFDSTRIDLGYRLKYTPRKKLVQIFTPYMVPDICMPGDTLNPLFLNYTKNSARYIDSIKKILTTMYATSKTVKSIFPSLSGVADFAQCEYRPFPLYARTFNMVKYAHEDDQAFKKFYHLVSGEFRYVLFKKGKPVAYAIYIPQKPQLSGAAAIPVGDSIVLTKFTQPSKMVAVSYYIYRPGSFLPKNMGFGYLNQGTFMLLQGYGGFISIPIKNGKFKNVKVQERWEEKSPKVNIINALALAYSGLPQLPAPTALGPK